MKQRTLEILDSFAKINPGIRIYEGSELQTVAVVKNMFGVAKVEDTFPLDFAIYGLNEFLSVRSLFDNPEFDYMDDHIQIAEGKNVTKFYYSNPAVIVSVEKGKRMAIGEERISFNLSAQELKTLIKGGSILKADLLEISQEGLRAYNSKGTDSSYNIEFGDDAEGELDSPVNIQIDLVRNILSDDYRVTVCERGVRFESEDVEYAIVIKSN